MWHTVRLAHGNNPSHLHNYNLLLVQTRGVCQESNLLGTYRVARRSEGVDVQYRSGRAPNQGPSQPTLYIHTFFPEEIVSGGHNLFYVCAFAHVHNWY